MKNIAMALGLLLLTACQSITTQYDFDPEHDFSQVKRYAWMQAVASQKENRLQNSLTQERIRRAVDRELAAKGMVIDESAPEVLLASHLTIDTRMDVNTMYSHYGYSYGRWNTGLAAQTQVVEYEVGQLLIDMVDPKAKRLLWRGLGEGRLRNLETPQEREEAISEAVAQILSNFPPGNDK